MTLSPADHLSAATVLSQVRSGPSRAGKAVRVCHVAATTEGATWMLEQLRELRNRHGYDVTAVVSGEHGLLVDRLHQANIPTFAFDFEFSSVSDLIRLPGKIFKLARFLRREQFDVVQTHLFHSMIIGRIAGWLADVPVRLSMIAGPYHLEAATPRWIDGATAWMDTVIIGSCRFTIGLYRSLGVPARRLSLIYYGPDHRAFDPAHTPPADIRDEFRWPETTPVIGMIAYFYAVRPASHWAPPALHNRAVKGHEYLIRAVPAIRREFPDVKVVLVGEGWEEGGRAHMDAMRALVCELGLLNVVYFAGFRNDVPGLLRAFDISVQPSLNENLGGTIESLLMARPTVATRVGGMPDSVREGVTGFLVEPADPNALAQGILRLLRNPAQARALGEAGRRLMLQRFTLDRTVDELHTLYRRRLYRRGRRRRGYRSLVSLVRVGALAPVSAYLAVRLVVFERFVLSARHENQAE